MPREEPWRRRRRQRTESTGHRHPQFLPGGRQFLFFVGGPDAVRGVYLGSLGSPEVTRLLASDTQGAYVAPGWLLFIRQGTLWAQRFDLARRKVSGEPIAVADSVGLRAHRRHRCVLDVGCGRDGVSRGPAFGDPALVVRSVWQCAWHVRISRAGGPVESQAVAGRPSRGRRAHAPERDGPVAARCHTPDALYARVRWEYRAPSSLVTGRRSDRVRIGPFGFGGAGRETIDRRWRGRRALRVAGDQDPVRLVARRAISPVLRSRSEDAAPISGCCRGERGCRSSSSRPRRTSCGASSPRTGAGWHTNRTKPGDMRSTCGRFPREAGRFPSQRRGGVYPRWSRDGKELYFIAPDAKMMAVTDSSNGDDG